jgi:hypothetical protein
MLSQRLDPVLLSSLPTSTQGMHHLPATVASRCAHIYDPSAHGCQLSAAARTCAAHKVLNIGAGDLRAKFATERPREIHDRSESQRQGNTMLTHTQEPLTRSSNIDLSCS